MITNLADISKSSKSRSKGTTLVAGSANTIYTCPNNYTAKVVLLFVTNTAGGNQTVTIQWYSSAEDTTYYIVGGYVVPAYSFLKLDGSYLTLNAGDYLIVTPEAGSVMDATVTVEEYFDPTQIR